MKSRRRASPWSDGVPRLNGVKRDVLLLLALVLLIRLPFLHQAVQGDDVYYLAAAAHAQVDPAHPNHVHYIFEGRDVDFRGYPHPPGNAWFLAALLALCGGVREVPFHLAYIVFTLLAVFGAYALARKLVGPAAALGAAFLLLATPALVVNGNSFESDVPLLGCWLAGTACFMHRRYTGAALFLMCSGLIAFQAVLFTPILLVYAWLFARRDKAAWAVALTPVATIALWQLFEYATSGTLPAAVASSYLVSYGYERFALKLRNLAMLGIHSTWLIFPPLLFAALWTARKRRDPQTLFLAAWCAIFFAGAGLFFYSGSMRYLLPMAAPVALLAARLPRRWLAFGFAVQLAIGLLLAIVNYTHWNAYRNFAGDVMRNAGPRRVWVDAEWGLRHYLERAGALPLRRDQWVPPGDVVVESELAYPAPYATGMSTPVPLLARTVTSRIPLRLIGLEARSGYSTVDKGYLPFDARGGAIDQLHAYVMQARRPELAFLPMGSAAADAQILSGVFARENQPWRWIGGRAVFLLNAPAAGDVFHCQIYLSDAAPARHIVVRLGDHVGIDKVLPGPGTYDLTAPAEVAAPTVVTVQLDKTFRAPGDSRDLGAVLNAIGFRH